jgi:3-methyladenine DNA glycosylase/8-oxoguanine DNA glycosylase
MELTWFLVNQGIEMEADLQAWLDRPGNASLLLELRGVGPKTVDYVKMLVGLPAVAVDRHVRAFVEEAGVSCRAYEDIGAVVECAAAELGVSAGALDVAIWTYMSSGRRHATMA